MRSSLGTRSAGGQRLQDLSTFPVAVAARTHPQLHRSTQYSTAPSNGPDDAVLPPNNGTGDPLLIESASFWHPDADVLDVSPVADALAAEARGQLARRGITVMAPEAVTTAIGKQPPRSPGGAAAWVAGGRRREALLSEIQRWEADMSPLHPWRAYCGSGSPIVDPPRGRQCGSPSVFHLHPGPMPGGSHPLDGLPSPPAK